MFWLMGCITTLLASLLSGLVVAILAQDIVEGPGRRDRRVDRRVRFEPFAQYLWASLVYIEPSGGDRLSGKTLVAALSVG